MLSPARMRGRRPAPVTSRTARGRGRRNPCWWPGSWVRMRACPEPRWRRSRAAVGGGGRGRQRWTSCSPVDNRPIRTGAHPTVAVMSVISPERQPGADPPPVVPGYTLEALLGRGGSGEVWRAVPRRGGAPVAVKVLVAGDPERQAKEAALLGALDHPHLVRLIEIVHQPRRGGIPRVALVLELLAGGSLAALLARRGRLRPGEVVTAMAPVAAALAHAHENGVVHGDLAPGNIVFTAEGRPVLTDLGVARVLGETAAGEVTPAYVDPTVARGGAPGPASDVFGIGAPRFPPLTGIAPWTAAPPADTLAVAAAEVLPDLAELARGAPAALLDVVSRGLAPDPHDRGSAAAFALDLRHACRPEPVRLPVAGAPALALGRTGRGPRTELTHQVPGRRSRPAPVVAEPGRRRHLRRPAVRRPRGFVGAHGRPALGAVLAVACVAATAWAGVQWAGGSRSGTGPNVAAATGAVPAAVVHGERADGAGTTGARTDTPAGPEDWREIVEELYARRAEAFATGSVTTLAGVYTDVSPHRAADAETVTALAQAGEELRGFAPTVTEVRTATIAGDRADLQLVDRWAAYEVVRAEARDGPAVQRVPGRAATEVHMVLVRTPAGWRIETAERSG